MISRLSKLPKDNSFFLFGPRGSGKTTLLKFHFNTFRTEWIDLLRPSVEEQYLLDPGLLERQILALLENQNPPDWVVIDEIQKVPKLLNLVHLLIEEKKIKFALTGSSARKLKQKGVNLLAGRAWVEHLFPFTHIELFEKFNSKELSLIEVLKWGTLPKVIEFNDPEDKAEFLSSYVQTYVKSEIQEEQWVRKIEPFRRFLPLVAQMNGQPLNYLSLSKDIGVDSNTIKSYYEILEDTLMGFHLPAYNRSLRKQQRLSSKFYIFDLGVKRQLERKLRIPLVQGTTEFGDAFEHFIVLEIYRLNLYYKKEFELSYLRTKDGVEIDLIIDRPGKPLVLLEIKSKSKVDERDIRHLESIGASIKNVELILISNDPHPQKIKNTKAYPWKEGLAQILS